MRHKAPKFKPDLDAFERARLAKNLRKKDIAEKIGKSPMTITLVWNGENRCTPTINAIAKVLGVKKPWIPEVAPVAVEV